MATPDDRRIDFAAYICMGVFACWVAFEGSILLIALVVYKFPVLADVLINAEVQIKVRLAFAGVIAFAAEQIFAALSRRIVKEVDVKEKGQTL
jgi:hypothetical protein